MKVETLTLDALGEAVRDMEKQLFVERYPGFFLVALGTLPAEEIRLRKRARIPGLQPEDTLALRYGDVLNPDGSKKHHPLRGQVFFLQGGPASDEILVGRGLTCELIVTDPSVSDIHCVMKVCSAELRVTDAQSTNGTSINLVRLPPQTEKILNDEDIVSFGRCSFQLFSAAMIYDQLSS